MTGGFCGNIVKDRMNSHLQMIGMTMLALAASAVNAQDVDNDGRISAREARGTELEHRFETIDANNDAHLDVAELRYDPRERRGSGGNSFDSIDANGDGRLSMAEAANDVYVDAHFEDWDIDDNGFLDDGELDNDWAEWDLDSFDAVDLDNDGMIDGDEASESGYVEYNFDRWDLDGNGRLSEQETNSGWMNEGAAYDNGASPERQ